MLSGWTLLVRISFVPLFNILIVCLCCLFFKKELQPSGSHPKDVYQRPRTGYGLWFRIGKRRRFVRNTKQGGVGSFNLHFILIIAFGGDVEMFACIGKNVTNWHFDGQDVRVFKITPNWKMNSQNFTIQLRGTKRWSVLPGVPCPLTNCNIIHPDSTAYGTYTVSIF